MPKKRMQVVSHKSFIPKDVREENQLSYDDPNYWKSLSEDDVQPDKQKQVSDERQQEIEKLYPVFTREHIPVEKLLPANEEWNFFPSQSKDTLDEMMKNIVVYGQLSPAIVWAQPDGNYMILGGHTRFYAIKKLHDIFKESGDEEQSKRFETMDCNVYGPDEIDEIEARKIIIFDNVIRRDNTTAIKARAVINMAQLEKETRAKRRPDTKRERALTKVAKVIGENENSVKKLYQLRSLIPEFWPLMDAKNTSDRITNQFARVIAGLDSNLQRYIYEKHLYDIKLSSLQMKQLRLVKTTEDIDNIFDAPTTYTVLSRGELDEKLPDDYVTFTVVCSNDELQTVKDTIKWCINERQDVSSKTKELIGKLFV